jgi:hypothetical protein
MTKQHSFWRKNNINLKKKFGKLQNAQNRKCYSTKIISNFVPQLKPKKSFCNPTPFLLDDNSSKQNDKENDIKFELDKISSCDEEESDKDSSSSFASDIEEEKESNIDVNNNINMNQNCIKDGQIVAEHGANKEVLISTKNESDSSFECHNSDTEKSEEQEKEKEKEKEEIKRKSNKKIDLNEFDNNKIIKDDFCLDGNKHNDNVIDIDFDINKKSYLSQKKLVINNNISSILDILSARKKKK